MSLRGVAKYLLVLLLTPCVSAIAGATFELLPLLISGKGWAVDNVARGYAAEDDQCCKRAADKVVFFHALFIWLF